MPRADSRRYLMSGIFTCGLCGAGLYGRLRTSGQLRYVCVKEPGHPGCGKVTIMADPADARARDVILTALDTPEFLAALITATSGPGTPAADITRQFRDLDARRDELARAYAARVMTRSGWLTAREQLTGEADQLAAALSCTQHSATLSLCGIAAARRRARALATTRYGPTGATAAHRTPPPLPGTTRPPQHR